MTTTEIDRRHMAAALELAGRMLGRTWPNPAVGCVVVRDGRVVGRGATRHGGRPHAETEALARAGDAARGATAYVTLEPCAHHGRTPPCADAIVAAGLARVVVAVEDSDSRTAGAGIARLRSAGIAVDVGLLGGEARELNAGFFSRVERGRPLVTLKVAASLDGCVASVAGDSKWITGAAARRRGHLLRASHDAIMVGSGTVFADDPVLTCRLGGLESTSPVRIVTDSGLRTPLNSLLVRSIPVAPLWLACGEGVESGNEAARLRAEGAEILPVRRDDDGRLSLPALAAALGERGLTRILLEGGPGLATAMLRHGLIDRLAWFSAPMLIGGDGRPALGALGVQSLGDAVAFEGLTRSSAGADTVLSFARVVRDREDDRCSPES